MKFISVLILSLVFISCNNEEANGKFSTVDSNVAGAPDSLPTALHLDSLRKDTSVPVALDSMGATINPADTVYKKDN